MTLGDYIKEYRKFHNLSMDDFAKATGLSKAYVSILERNCNPSTGKAAVPSLGTIKRVAVATNIDFNDLISILDNSQKTFIDQHYDPECLEAQPVTVTGQTGTGKSNLINKTYASTLTPWGKPILGMRSGKRIIHRTPKQPPEQPVFVSYSHREDSLPVEISEYLKKQLDTIELPRYNLVCTYAVDGTSKIRQLSDEQFSALTAILDQMPDTYKGESPRIQQELEKKNGQK